MEALTPGFGTILWMTIAFGLVFFILAKYAWKPILSSLKARENSIEEALELAKKAKEDMATLKADNEKIIAEAKMERDKIFKEARELKDVLINDAKKEANTEAKKIIDLAKQAIKNEKETAINEIKEQIVNLSVNIAEKLLYQKLSIDSEQKELIEKSMRDVKLN